MDAIKLASYEGIRAELNALRQCLDRKRNHKPSIDLQTWRLQKAHILGNATHENHFYLEHETPPRILFKLRLTGKYVIF
jgi:hypothetical protein